MIDVLTFLIAGSVFGLAGGFSPGPTTTVIVSQTLRFGVMDGIKVAIAPALTDAPIIIVAVLLVGQLGRFEPALGIISLLGAAFLLYLAFESFRVRGIEVDEAHVEPRSISKGFEPSIQTRTVHVVPGCAPRGRIDPTERANRRDSRRQRAFSMESSGSFEYDCDLESDN
jgi:threonine/homoserine/homoserine lactone efflux protein